MVMFLFSLPLLLSSYIKPPFHLIYRPAKPSTTPTLPIHPLLHVPYKLGCYYHCLLIHEWFFNIFFHPLYFLIIYWYHPSVPRPHTVLLPTSGHAFVLHYPSIIFYSSYIVLRPYFELCLPEYTESPFINLPTIISYFTLPYTIIFIVIQPTRTLLFI